MLRSAFAHIQLPLSLRETQDQHRLDLLRLVHLLLPLLCDEKDIFITNMFPL